MKVYQIPSLKDNYIHILKNKDEVLVVDPSTAEDVISFLDQKGWGLNYILNTHHHQDHIGGNLKLKAKYKSLVLGFEKDKHRLPGIDQTLKSGEVWCWQESECHVLFIPGHTLGHIAFWFKKEGVLFCGDTLFAMGCGRLFEGTSQQLHQSLNTLSQLPETTQIYCGHEYSEKNGRFALSVEGKNIQLQERFEKILEMRSRELSTVPFTLKEELQTNPFLRTGLWLQDQFQTVTSATLLKKQKSFRSKQDIFFELRKMRNDF